MVHRGGMLPLSRQFGGGQGEGVYHADETAARGDVENCDANCQETCGKCWMRLLLFRYCANFHTHTCRVHPQKSATTNLQRICPGQRSEPLYMDWCWWILGGLPFPHLVRVMDCYFHEGIKVFYRIALAILILFNKNAAVQALSASPGGGASGDASGSTAASGSGGGTTKNNGNGSSTMGSSGGDWTAAGGFDKNDIDNALPMFCRNIPVSPTKLLRTAFSIRALR